MSRIGYSRAPAYIRFQWLAGGLNRTHVIPVRPSVPFGIVPQQLTQNDGTEVNIQTAVNNYFPCLVRAVGNAALAATWEFFRQANEDTIPVPVSSGAYTGPAITAVPGTTNPAFNVLTISYRGIGGSRGKLVYSGTPLLTPVRFPLAGGNATDAIPTIREYLLGATNVIMTPADEFPGALRGATTKSNDVLLKRARG